MDYMSRLNAFISILVTNIFAIVITVINNGGLFELAIIYWCETVILVFFNLVAITKAKRLPSDARTAGFIVTNLLLQKLISFFMALLLPGAIITMMYLALFIGFHAEGLSSDTKRVIGYCVFMFFVNHLMCFRNEVKLGLHDELLREWEIVAPAWRGLSLVVALPLLKTQIVDGINYTLEQIVFVMSIFAIANIWIFMTHFDKCNEKAKIIN